MPSSPAFPSHHCHTLPNELIDQILSDKTLSKLDLSNCTRVNRQFLPFALQHLYKTVALEIDQFGNFYDPGRIKWSYSDSGNSLVSILERSAKHQHLITKVVVYLGRIKDISVRVGYVSRHPDAAIRHLLSLVPNVKSVTFPQDWNELPMVRTVIYDEGSRFEELDIGGDIELGELESWSKLPKLRKLKCHSLQSRNNSETVNIPPQLEILDLGSNDDPLPTPSPNAQLRVLCGFVSHDLLLFVNRSPNLQHLILTQNHRSIAPLLDPLTLSQFSQLPNLQSFTFSSPYSQTPTLTLLLNHLPASLKRLDFPQHIPFDHLATFFAPPDFRSIRILGLSLKDAQKEVNRGNMGTLKKMCQAKGIRIEYVGEVKGVFRESLTSRFLDLHRTC